MLADRAAAQAEIDALFAAAGDVQTIIDAPPGEVDVAALTWAVKTLARVAMTGHSLGIRTARLQIGLTGTTDTLPSADG